MQLIFSFITWLAYVSPFMLPPEASRPTQMKQISTADYAGTWVGRTATSEFKLVLEERKNYRLPNNLYYDVIIGRHSFVTKGSTLKNESLSKSSDSFVLFGMFDSRFPGQLSAVFHDDVNHKSVNVRVSFVAGNKNKILWQVTGENEVIITKPGVKFLPGISVPTSFTLEKVK